MNDTCVICGVNSQRLPSPAGILAETDQWVVAHHHSPRGLYPGRVMLSTRRHVGSFADLTPEEAASFGPMVQRVSAALLEVVQPARVYLASFNEGSAHIHVHLLSRFPDETEIGPEIVLKRMRQPVCSVEEATPVAIAIKQHLAG